MFDYQLVHHAMNSRFDCLVLLLMTSIIGTVASTVYAEENQKDTVNAITPAVSTTSDHPDSLRSAIEKLRQEAEVLRQRADAIKDSIDDIEVQRPEEVHPGETPSVQPKEKEPLKDTVQFLAREGTQAFLETIRGKKRGARERGYGGGIGPCPGIHAFNVNPVKDVISRLKKSESDEFHGIDFSLNRAFESFFLMGLTGYGALGNGLRIGGGFRSGSKSPSAQLNNSNYTLEIKTTFGGLLIEKAIVKGDINWLFGGMVGGSNIKLQLFKTDDDPDPDLDADPYRKFKAAAVLLELHGGFTYTMINWFHIGLDLSMPLYFSGSGFKTPTDRTITTGFISINPGLHFRIILGNIG